MKPPVEHQGTIIVERDPDGGWLIVTPDGAVTHQPSVYAAGKAAKEWCRKHLTVTEGFGVARIEWRG